MQVTPQGAKGACGYPTRLRIVSKSWWFTFCFGMLFGVANGQAQQRNIRLDNIAGCFELNWTPWVIHGTPADNTWQTPRIERRVWLTLTRIVRPSTGEWFVVRPAPGEDADSFGDVRWSWNSDTGILILEWDASMSGVRVELRPQSHQQDLVATFAGAGHWWSHDTKVPDGLEARVVATRQTCTLQD